MPRLIASVVALVVAAPAIAAAQGAAPPPQRSGLAIEGELGVGVLGASNPAAEDLDTVGAVVSGRLGGFVSPRLCLLVLAGVTTGEFEDPDFGGPGGNLSELYLGAALRLWTSRRLWLEVNVATTRLIVDRLGFADEEVFAGGRIGGTAGLVLFEGQKLNLDGRLGLATAGYHDEVSSGSLWLSVGLTTK